MTLTGLTLLYFQHQLSSSILSMMDSSVDPCTDFYDFACGNFVKNAKIPDDKNGVFTFLELQEKVALQIRDLLESNNTPTDAPSALAQQYYKSCTNIPAMEIAGLDPLKQVIRKLGGWPTVDGEHWNNTSQKWIAQTAKLLLETGVSPIINFFVAPDLDNSTRYVLQIDQPKFGLGKRDYYVDKNNTKGLDAYRKFITATAVQLGADANLAAKDAEDVVEFETALAKISTRDEDRRDIQKMHAPTSVKLLKTIYAKLNIQAWFDYVTTNNWIFDDSEVVNVAGASFLDQLDNVLANYSERTIANYQIWKLVQDLVVHLAPSQRENYRRYTQALSGTPKFQPRWKECLAYMQKYVKWPLGSMYVKSYFTSEIKKDVDNMISKIRQVMKTTIEDLDWIDSSTKSYALKKLSNMINNMAYPADEINNEQWIMRDLKDAQIKDNRYMDNYLSVSASIQSRIIREFYDSINRTQWQGDGPTNVNAFYSWTNNKMIFPAAILQYPFYISTAPAYVNYGRIGAIMGHELTHGYDDLGRQYDAEGNLVNWWTNETLSKYKSKAKCFVDQYGNVTDELTGLKLNGENTQGENIADNGGVKLAYKAYHLWQNNSSNGTSPEVLPRMQNFTSDQVFFISYAQVWCSVSRKEFLKQLIIRDVHSPNKPRANVALQNNDDFATVFNCPKGSPMNPKNKCSIW